MGKLKADTLQEAFERHYQQRIDQARAITPGLRLEVVAQLRKEMLEGRIPTRHGVVKVDPDHPAVKGALEGRAIEMDGDTVAAAEKGSAGTNAIQLSSPRTRLVILLVVGAVFVMAVASLVFWQSRSGKQTPPDDVAVEVQLTPTLALPTMTPVVAAATVGNIAPPLPTAIPTSTPPIVFNTDDAGGRPSADPYDPISIELAGQAYVLGVGRVWNGIWEPEGAEWLPGTELRRVVALPYDPDLLQALFNLRPDEEMVVYLRSGTAVRYRLRDIQRVPRNRVDILSDRSPSLAIPLYGEPGSDRWVVIGEALQSDAAAGGFTSYLPAPPISDTMPLPTIVITTTPHITHAATTVTITACEYPTTWDGQSPSSSQHQFVVCEIVVTGDGDPSFLTITELDWAQASFLPNPLPVTDSRTQVAGLVRQTDSQPVLVWDDKDGGVRYIVHLAAE